MSVSEARKLLWANADRYTDEELKRILDFYSAIANAIMDEKLK